MIQEMEKMEKAAQLHHMLSSLVDGAGLENFKFFLGSNRDITADDMHTQAIKAFSQIKLGTAKNINTFDESFASISIEKFLS